MVVEAERLTAGACRYQQFLQITDDRWLRKSPGGTYNAMSGHHGKITHTIFGEAMYWCIVAISPAIWIAL